MKKIIILLLVVSLILSIVFVSTGCKASAETTAAETTAAATTVAASATTAAPETTVATDTTVIAKPYDGITVRILNVATPLFETAYEELKTELLEKEGITLEWSQIPFGDYISSKMLLALQEEQGTYDLCVWCPVSKPQVYGQGFFESLKPFIDNKDLTPADFDYADFEQSYMDSICSWPDTGLMELPITANAMVLFYRTDLFEKAGLQPPKTWDEYLAAAKKLNDPTNGVYGNILMGKQSSQTFYQYATILGSLEGKSKTPFVIDLTTYEPTLNTPEGREAVEIFLEAAKYAPPEFTTYDWNGAQEAMQAGKGAMFIQWNNSKGMYEDAKISKVAGKVMTALIPGASHPWDGTWGCSLLSASKNKEAAWKVMTYMFDKQHILKYSTDARTNWIPARVSAASSPEMLKSFPDMPVMLQQLATTLSEPPIAAYAEIQTLVDTNLVALLQGAMSTDDFLKTTDDEIRKILVREEVIK